MKAYVVVCLEGNGSRPSHKGAGYRETDKMYTLNATEVHSVAYLASGKKTTGCLMASGYEKLGAQEMFSGDYCIIEERPKTTRMYWDGTQIAGTLTAKNAAGSQRMPDKENFNCIIEERPRKERNHEQYVLAIDRAAFNQGKNAKYDFTVTDGAMPTIIARGPNAVCYRQPVCIGLQVPTTTADGRREVVKH